MENGNWSMVAIIIILVQLWSPKNTKLQSLLNIIIEQLKNTLKVAKKASY